MEPITTTKELAAACTRLAKHDFITVDTEFLRETTYFPILCVAQTCEYGRGRRGRRARRRHRPCAVLQADGEREGAEGLSCGAAGHRDRVASRQVDPAPRCSTPRSPRWCSATATPFPMINLCSASPATRSTSRTASPTGRVARSPPAQFKYAVSDVTHLRDVYLALSADIAKRERDEWVTEEMKILTSPDTYRMEPESAWQRLKTRARKPKELAVLMEVAAWREQRGAGARRTARARAQGRSDRRSRRAGADDTGKAWQPALASEGLRAIEMGPRHSGSGQARTRARSEIAAAHGARQAGHEWHRHASNCSRCSCA